MKILYIWVLLSVTYITESTVSTKSINISNSTLTCQDHITSNCSWWPHNDLLVTINKAKPCIFNCSFGNEKELTAVLQLDVHLLNNPFQSNVFINVEQENFMSAWTLPIIFKKQGTDQIFTSIQQELCPSTNPEHISFRITTSNEEDVKVKVGLTKVLFNLNTGAVNVTSTPVSPWVKLYIWEDSVQSVLVAARSIGDVSSKICALLSVQNAKCPVNVDWTGITAGSGHYQTFLDRGGMIVRKSDFPDGLFIVTLPLPDNELCNRIEGKVNKTSRKKTIELEIIRHETIGDAWLSLLGATGLTLVILIASIFTIVTMIHRNFVTIMKHHGQNVDDLVRNYDEMFHIRLISRFRAMIIRRTGGYAEGGYEQLRNDEDPDEPLQPQLFPVFEHEDILQPIEGPEGNGAQNQLISRYAAVGLHEGTMNLTESFNPRLLVWWNSVEAYKEDGHQNDVGEVAFHKNVAIMGLLMAEPLMDILNSFMKTTEHSQDVCLFNDRCVTSLGPITDFPRVFTSAAYVVCGLGFGYLTYKHRQYTSCIKGHFAANKIDVGVSYNYSIFKSLAYGLFLQGIMSAMYHICPNSTTLRFDMMFIYVLAIFFIIGIYGLRHNNISQHAYSTIGLVAIGLFMAKFQERSSTWLFWLIFGGFHFLLTSSTTVMINTCGTWSFNPLDHTKLWRGWKPVMTSLANLDEHVTSRFNMWTILRNVLGAGANLLLLLIGILFNMDAYMYLLAVCVINLTVYALHYVFTKIILHKEQKRGSFFGLFIFLLAICCWIAAIVFFGIKTSDSQATPAASRSLNEQCLFGLFSAHDVWHVLSAFSLLYAFTALLIIDDDLVATQSKEIPVF